MCFGGVGSNNRSPHQMPNLLCALGQQKFRVKCQGSIAGHGDRKCVCRLVSDEAPIAAKSIWKQQGKVKHLPCHHTAIDLGMMARFFVWLRNAGAAIVRAGVQVACGPPFWKAMGKLRMGSGAEFSRQPRCTGRAFEPCAAVCCIQRPGALQQHCATVCTCLVEASLFSEDGGKTGGSTGPASHPPPNRGGACSGEGSPPIWRPESGRAPIAGRAPHGAQALAVTHPGGGTRPSAVKSACRSEKYRRWLSQCFFWRKIRHYPFISDPYYFHHYLQTIYYYLPPPCTTSYPPVLPTSYAVV